MDTVFGSSLGGQETLIGIVGKDFVVLGADSSVTSSSIAWTATNLDKIAILENACPTPVAAAVIGDSADSDRLVGILRAHCAIREWETSHGRDVEYYHRPSPPHTGSATTTFSEPSSSKRRKRRRNKSPRPPFVVSTMMEGGGGLHTNAVAHLARTQIARALRSRNPLHVCLLIAGMSSETTMTQDSSSFNGGFAQRLQKQIQQASNEEEATNKKKDPQSKRLNNDTTTMTARPELYWLDPYGSLQKLESFGAHGYGSNFCLSILDQGYRPEMTRQEAIALVRSCFDQLRIRYVLDSPQPPCIKCLDCSATSFSRMPASWTLIRPTL